MIYHAVMSKTFANLKLLRVLIVTVDLAIKPLCVCLQLLETTIRPDTSLVSVMTINNEIGVKQPIEEIGRYGSI